MKLTVAVLSVLIAANASAQTALSQLSAVESSGGERSGKVLENSISRGSEGDSAPVAVSPSVDVSPSALARATATAMKGTVHAETPPPASGRGRRIAKKAGMITLSALTMGAVGAAAGALIGGEFGQVHDSYGRSVQSHDIRGIKIGFAVGLILGVVAETRD